MAKSTSQKVKVGIFVVVGTILLVGILYFIGKQQNVFGKNIQLFAVFENVDGLQLGNNVRYSGINVGTVTKIEMTAVGLITIEMTIEEETANFIKKDAITSIGSDGLVGSMVVNIVPGKNKEAKAVASGDTIGTSRGGTDEMLATLSTTNENVAVLSADLLKITQEILEGKGTLGMLVSDTILAQNIQGIVLDLSKTSKEANAAIAKINNMVSKIKYDESAAAVILSDKDAANQVKSMFANLEKSSKDMNEVTKNLTTYLNEIKAGKGALNHITQDKNLVREIDSTMLNIKEASEKLNENMDALKHNFLFKGYFKKQDKKEKKELKNK
jgi:phospholipid/cholesterol/gamma-HCH transport system substrate-binding protein